MSTKLPIIEQEFITSSNKKLDGIERVVKCPMWLCHTSVKKNCSKCLNKIEINNKNNYVLCKYDSKYY